MHSMHVRISLCIRDASVFTNGLRRLHGSRTMVDSMSSTANRFPTGLIYLHAPYYSPFLSRLPEYSGRVVRQSLTLTINMQYVFSFFLGTSEAQTMKKVFDDPDASDPSHSLLSKDHFGLILNEPAGKIAKMVVEYTVNLIVQVSQSEACIYYATSDMSCL